MYAKVDTQEHDLDSRVRVFDSDEGKLDSGESKSGSKVPEVARMPT